MINDIWINMGFIRWPMLFAILWAVGTSLYAATRLYKPGAEADLRTKAWIDATLFWGMFTAVTGVLGTLIGVIIAAQSIEAAGAVSGPLVWGGIKVALLSSAFGILALGVASLSWFALQLRWRFLQAREADE